jgi:hypothetical protein
MEPDVAVIRLPYVKSYVDRSGKVRRYFRKPGSKTVPLPGVPGCAEFMSAYQDALGEPSPKTRSARTGQRRRIDLRLPQKPLVHRFGGGV